MGKSKYRIVFDLEEDGTWTVQVPGWGVSHNHTSVTSAFLQARSVMEAAQRSLEIRPAEGEENYPRHRPSCEEGE